MISLDITENGQQLEIRAGFVAMSHSAAGIPKACHTYDLFNCLVI